MRGFGAPTLGPGEPGSKGCPPPAPPNKRRRGASGPGREKFVRSRGRGPRAPPRTMARPSAGRPSAAPRHAPAPQGCGPVPGACPSRRPRPPLARRGRSSCSRTGSGRAGSAASTSSAPATRTPGSGTASPPTVSSGGRGRQLGSPPGPSPGGGGGGAAASGHRRRRPSSSHRRQVARAAPFGAEAGRGAGDGAVGAGEERQARGLLSSPAALPSPERQRLQVRFPPGARTNAGGAFSLPNERRLGGGREGGHVLRGAAWTHNGGRSWGDFLKGLLESCRSEEGVCRTFGLALPCLRSTYPVGPSTTPLT